MKSAALCLLLAVATAFAPSRPVLTPGRLIQGRTMASFVLKAEEKQAEEEVPQVAADGTYFDDEVGCF